jgi:hypothetical protein
MGQSHPPSSPSRGEGVRAATGARNRRYIGFFAILGVLGSAAVVIPLVYNLRLQLTPEQVEQARERWRASGPASYDIDYQERHTHAGETDETAYRVLVRDRRVVGVARDGELTLLAGSAPALTLGPWPRALPGPDSARDIDGMFDHIESQLHQDLSQNRRPYATATFDPRDGHPTRYVRRIRGGAERLEWTVKLVRIDDAGS